MYLFEHHKKPLLPLEKFYRRLFSNFLLGMFILLSALGIGTAGYMYLAHLKFVDALLNASMILGGMGPVNVLTNDAAKYFASAYALFSGITILSTVGVIFAPVVHRAMHKFHIETEEEEDDSEDSKQKK